ncbi:MAG: tetratricopeptide repeat protein, partial [Chitinophaga rupis]
MLLIGLCHAYRIIDYNKGIPYGQQALTLAEKIHWTVGEGHAELALAGCYWGKSDYVYALVLAEKALKIYREVHDQAGIRTCLVTIGTISFGEAQYEKALDYFKQAQGLTGDEASLLENIAMTYGAMKEPALTAEYFRKAMLLFQQQGRVLNAIHSLNSMGDALTSLGRYPEAEVALYQALALAQQQNDSVGIGLGFERLGLLERAKGRYLKAISFLKKAHTLVAARDDRGELVENDDQIGTTYLLIAKGQRTEGIAALQRKYALRMAVDYLRQAVALARTVSTWNALLECERNLCEAAILDQRPGEAIRALEQYAAFSDSLFNKETQRKFTENLLTYDFSRQRDSLNQQAVLEHVHRKQDLLYAILIITVISLVALGVVFMNRLERLRLKSRLNDVTFSALRSQMNPHFIFNCLNSIKLYTEQNDSTAASVYLTKFSRLIRVMLQNSRSETIPLSSELELLRLYL